MGRLAGGDDRFGARRAGIAENRLQVQALRADSRGDGRGVGASLGPAAPGAAGAPAGSGQAAANAQ
jgi:hypothetical protein